MRKTFPTAQAAADYAVSYSMRMGWGASGRMVKTAKVSKDAYFAMARVKGTGWHRGWAHIERTTNE